MIGSTGRGRAVALVLVLALAGCAGDGGGDGAARVSTTAPRDSTTTVPAATDPSTAPSTTVAHGDLAGRTIVVDPGHNGANGAHAAEIGRLVDAGGFRKPCNTTGAQEGELTESRANWEIAQVLAADLRQRGATVVLTRDSDDGWGPCVDQRALTAQRVGADVIVSVHADGADPSASGFHVIRAASGPTVTAEVRDASAAFAVDVRDALRAQGLRPATYVGGDEGIVERTDIATLNRAGVPGVMVECGNLHNPGDLELLGTDAGRARIAAGLAAGVAAYLG